MATTFSLRDNLSNLGNDVFSSLSRRIDNEIAGDFLPAPSFPTNERPVVKTAANEQGLAKLAGTGGSFFTSQNTGLLLVGAVGVGAVIWLAMR